MTKQSIKSKGKKARRRKNPETIEFVQGFIPIKDIKNGIVETTDGRYIKILEIEPTNFLLRSSEEQFNIISSFASWLKISPVKMQFKSITHKADSDKHISMVRKELEAEDNAQCKEMGQEYIKLIKDVGNKEALTRRFFLIFEYEPPSGHRKFSQKYSDIYGMIQTTVQNARVYFNQCGNQHYTASKRRPFVAEILYMFFNRKSCVAEPFNTRMERIVVDTMASKNKIIGIDPVPSIKAVNFIAPRGIDFSHFNYILMDGIYYSILYIRSQPQTMFSEYMISVLSKVSGNKLISNHIFSELNKLSIYFDR